MFKDCTTGGYNLEGCQASPEKLIALMILIALAMTSVWLRGWGGDKEVYEIDCIRVAARIPC
jgi:hypothetical protein